ncbi:hypothetical protein Plim_1340 [Planctopirus limnophila DSM 3776]|uniref:Uncharacterized protein n=1 Tax=Planctopirus limnophila (strain ATCC 43296 / DSM 3776 / IFAM 1008 / Mu 290) TaxID=521674 RepID=D5SVA4_PLAL2|nr:hypothetical protein Plim_1340 [Planctopirus limnophila DSM 3776]
MARKSQLNHRIRMTLQIGLAGQTQVDRILMTLPESNGFIELLAGSLLTRSIDMIHKCGKDLLSKLKLFAI